MTSELERHLGDDDRARLASTEPFARRMQLALMGGNYEEAHAAVDACQSAMRRANRDIDKLTCLGEVRGLEVRTLNALEEYCDIVTVGDLADTDVQRLLNIPNLAEKGLSALLLEIVRKLL